MADQLYLSLWFPNFQLEALPAALTSVMRQFALISEVSKCPGGKRVAAAAAYPISFSEAPTYQRLYVTDERAEENQDTSASIIETAVAEATEQLHDDMAYEFEMKWNLWTPDSGPGSPAYDPGSEASEGADPRARLDTLWRPLPATVKIIGFGPQFDEGDFEQNGHVRVDFGLDYPWVLDDEHDPGNDNPDHDGRDPDNLDEVSEAQEANAEDAEVDLHNPDLPYLEDSSRKSATIIPFNRVKPSPAPEQKPDLPEAAQYIQRNVELLLAFTLSVEKHCGISSRLLWTESGEPLAEKLIARLQRLH